jgi:hypothetical protein
VKNPQTKWIIILFHSNCKKCIHSTNKFQKALTTFSWHFIWNHLITSPLYPHYPRCHWHYVPIPSFFWTKPTILSHSVPNLLSLKYIATHKQVILQSSPDMCACAEPHRGVACGNLWKSKLQEYGKPNTRTYNDCFSYGLNPSGCPWQMLLCTKAASCRICLAKTCWLIRHQHLYSSMMWSPYESFRIISSASVLLGFSSYRADIN